ncbi:MAG: hypothetical protein CUN53_01800 [Phototrophicales bacterium]|nr:MAG: hypothetical protein CUN53_01800 [Phototrophicales bacterium]
MIAARAALCLIPIWAALIVLACLGGGVMPMPEFFAHYAPGRCGAAWCLLGVIPGRTTWSEAQYILAAQRDGQISERQIIIILGRGGEIGFYPGLDGGLVGRILVHYPPERGLPVGWIIQRYGAPCGVSFYWRARANILTLRYPRAMVNLKLQSTAFNPMSPVETIQLDDPAFSPSYQTDRCVDNISDGVNNTAWQGFVRLSRYERAP